VIDSYSARRALIVSPPASSASLSSLPVSGEALGNQRAVEEWVSYPQWPALSRLACSSH